jgi:hypothetical protein
LEEIKTVQVEQTQSINSCISAFEESKSHQCELAQEVVDTIMHAQEQLHQITFANLGQLQSNVVKCSTSICVEMVKMKQEITQNSDALRQETCQSIDALRQEMRQSNSTTKSKLHELETKMSERHTQVTETLKEQDRNFTQLLLESTDFQRNKQELTKYFDDKMECTCLVLKMLHSEWRDNLLTIIDRQNPNQRGSNSVSGAPPDQLYHTSTQTSDSLSHAATSSSTAPITSSSSTSTEAQPSDQLLSMPTSFPATSSSSSHMNIPVATNSSSTSSVSILNRVAPSSHSASSGFVNHSLDQPQSACTFVAPRAKDRTRCFNSRTHKDARVFMICVSHGVKLCRTCYYEHMQQHPYTARHQHNTSPPVLDPFE